jgi:hypothetical protein
VTTTAGAPLALPTRPVAVPVMTGRGGGGGGTLSLSQHFRLTLLSHTAVSHCLSHTAVSHCLSHTAVSHCLSHTAASHCLSHTAASHCLSHTAASHCHLTLLVSHCCLTLPPHTAGMCYTCYTIGSPQCCVGIRSHCTHSPPPRRHDGSLAAAARWVARRLRGWRREPRRRLELRGGGDGARGGGRQRLVRQRGRTAPGRAGEPWPLYRCSLPVTEDTGG